MSIPLGLRHRISKATFKIRTQERGDGQCVLVEGGLIFTAAHCVDYDCGGGMALGDYCMCNIATGSGEIMARTLAVEPVSDIGVLGRPDDQSQSTEASAFDEIINRFAPIKLQRRIPKAHVPFPVWIRKHTKTWVAGKATYYNGATFAYETASLIPSGTSGGSIVSRAGELVGVVSHGSTSCVKGRYHSAAPFLRLALPAWVIARSSRHGQMG